MKSRKALFAASFLSLAALSLQTLAGTATPSSILVIPARARLVQLAFQIASVQDVGLVCHDTSAVSSDLLIHVWNGQEWVRITPDEYSSGAFMSGTARDVYILGPANSIPPLMSADPFWGKTTHRITDLDTATILNTLGKTMKLSARDWKWLAAKNGLTLTDTNSERRRYGRWGKSGVDASALPSSRTKAAPASLPPSDVIIMPSSDPIAETTPAPDVKPSTPPPVAPSVVAPPPAPAVEAPAIPEAPIAPPAPAIDPTTK